jgi:membrane protein
MTRSSAWTVARETVTEFVEDDAMTLAAALAYYTALGMSPLLVLLLWIATFAGEDAQQQLVAQLQGLVGPEGGRAVKAVVDNADATPELGTLAGVVSLATFLFSVSGVFAQLQAALNRMWDVTAAPGTTGTWPWIRKRLLSLGTFLSVGFVLVVSLAVTALVEAASERARDVLPGADLAWSIVTFVLALAVSAVLFALIFKVLPDVTLGWRDVAVGGVATAILFSIGRWAIGLYLGRSSIGSAYGAAGSLVVLLVWVYYAALVVLLGAELTQVLARRRGTRIEPEAHAIGIERHEEPRPDPRPSRASPPPRTTSRHGVNRRG